MSYFSRTFDNEPVVRGIPCELLFSNFRQDGMQGLCVLKGNRDRERGDGRPDHDDSYSLPSPPFPSYNKTGVWPGADLAHKRAYGCVRVKASSSNPSPDIRHQTSRAYKRMEEMSRRTTTSLFNTFEWQNLW